jgi:hypothetical protein
VLADEPPGVKCLENWEPLFRGGRESVESAGEVLFGGDGDLVDEKKAKTELKKSPVRGLGGQVSSLDEKVGRAALFELGHGAVDTSHFEKFQRGEGDGAKKK